MPCGSKRGLGGQGGRQGFPEAAVPASKIRVAAFSLGGPAAKSAAWAVRSIRAGKRAQRTNRKASKMLMRRPRGWRRRSPGPQSRRCASLLLPGAGGREQRGAGPHAARLMAALMARRRGPRAQRAPGLRGCALRGSGLRAPGPRVPAAGAGGSGVCAESRSGRLVPSYRPAAEACI